MKRTRTFLILTGPVVVPTEEGYEVVQAPKQHRIRGCEIKYFVADPTMFHIVDIHGNVVFASSQTSVLWCHEDQAAVVSQLHSIDEEDDVDEDEDEAVG